MIKLKTLLIKEEKENMVEAPNPNKMKTFIDKFKKTSDGKAVSLIDNNNIWMRKDLVNDFEKYLNAMIKGSSKSFSVKNVSVEKLNNKEAKFNGYNVSFITLLQLIRVARHLL